MDKGVKIQELVNKLEELNLLIRERFKDELKISTIDIDLASEKVRNIYDLLLQIKPQIDQLPVEDHPDVKEPVVTADAVEEEIQISETDESEIENADILISPLKEAEPAQSKMETDKPDLFSTTSKEKKSTKEAIGDIFSETQIKETVADKMQKDKIGSLKIGIGINDKFFFINELFDGNLNDYTRTLDELDSFLNLDEARNYIVDLGEQRNWIADSEAVQLLNSFIDRKFM